MEWPIITIVAVVLWVIICDCTIIAGAVIVTLLWIFVWDDTKPKAPVAIVQSIATNEITDTHNREDYCPEVPEDYSVKWIEYNGEITCTMGDKL